MNRAGLFGLLALSTIITGCTHCRVCAPVTTEVPVAVSTGVVTKPTTILATGYGASTSNGQTTAGQQRLMAMRAARVDAYRNLAEQVYGFRVSGSTAVASFATQNDSVRTYVDAFIRGARLVNMASFPDGTYEATVELELTPTFLRCVSVNATAGCTTTASFGNVNCLSAGCTQPSAHYYTVE